MVYVAAMGSAGDVVRVAAVRRLAFSSRARGAATRRRRRRPDSDGSGLRRLRLVVGVAANTTGVRPVLGKQHPRRNAAGLQRCSRGVHTTASCRPVRLVVEVDRGGVGHGVAGNTTRHSGSGRRHGHRSGTYGTRAGSRGPHQWTLIVMVAPTHAPRAGRWRVVRHTGGLHHAVAACAL